MLKKIILLLTVATLYTAEITNIVVQQRTDGSGIIDVTYDLIDSEDIYPSFNVSIEMSIDEAEYSTLSTGDLSGDIGENVIPGVSKSIQIQAPGETYSNNVVVKIIASATVVSGELPFTMISISSIQGVSSYQEETIDYNFQMMQYELTNADLVTFLETYDFTLDENGNATYDCSNYTEYFNSGSSDHGCDDCIYGCTEMGAMNYNPSANVHTECIYENQVGCTDSNAHNYNDEAEYDNCSCYNTYTQEQGDLYSWVTMPGCNWTANQESYQAIELASYFSDWFSFMDNHMLEINLCDNQGAQNFPHEILDLLMNYPSVFPGENIDESCWQFIGYDSCIYQEDCDMSYLDPPSGADDDTDYGTTDISEFSTQHISYEGLSFVIESGTGSKPALFDYNTCVDGVIVGLLLEYYGLRFPTAGEWTKAARQDNNRCWPWMNTNCEDANEAYCSSEYQCLSEEDFDACQEDISTQQLDCNNSCVLDNDTCEADCGCDMSGGGDSDNDCDFYNDSDDIDGCNNDEDCTYFSDTCVSNCYGCMMNPDTYEYCIGDTGSGDNANPCNDGCPCCATCDMSGGGSSCDEDCLTQCQLDQNACYNDCNDYSNSWEICGGEEMQHCENNYNNCTDYNFTWQECEEIQQNNLAQLLEQPSEYHEYGFLSTIYLNKFYNIYEENFGEGWDNESLDLSDVGQYPEGLSSFGLYDMIGNAPEIIKHNNLLWLIGPTPYESQVFSFCGNDNNMFMESSWNQSMGQVLTNYQGTNFNLYGLRLARTTQ